MKGISQRAVILVLWTYAGLSSPLASAHAQQQGADEPIDQPSQESIFHVTSKWITQDGKQVTLASFKGAPFVVALIYTSCQAVCPLILSDMLEIERRLSPAAQRTRFVAISLDPKRDTPGTLLAYAKQRKLDLSRWTLLTGDEDDVREIAAVLGMRYRQVAGGDFVHSSLITVVDGEGVIRRQQIGLRQDPAESVRVITQLVTP